MVSAMPRKDIFEFLLEFPVKMSSVCISGQNELAGQNGDLSRFGREFDFWKFSTADAAFGQTSKANCSRF